MTGDNKKKAVFLLAAVMVLSGIIGIRIHQNITVNKARAAQAETKAAAVQVAEAVRRDIASAVSFSGSLEPVWMADISSKVDGRINRLDVHEGDTVHSGQVIAVLDTSELAAQVLQAQGNLAAAQSNLEQAALDFQRYSTLADKGAISAQMLDGARTKRDLAVGQVRAAEGSLALMQEKLNNAQVTVPQNGVIVKRYLQSGAFTRAGSPIVSVADVSVLIAKATVGEAQVAGLNVGMKVKVTVDALDGREVNGTVSRVSPMAELPARTFTAEIAVPNDQGVLKAGMFAKVEIPGRVHADALTVPESALVLREDQRTVFVVTADNKVQQRLIKVGAVSGGYAEVLDGLESGETIVVGGQNKIKDGAVVTPVREGGQ